MRRPVLASALLATLLFVPAIGLAPAALAASPTAPPIIDLDPSKNAIHFMSGAQRADGSIDASISETADYVIGVADVGYDPTLLAACSRATALDFLAIASDKAAADAAKTAKAILAVEAAHLDPTGFKGRDLLARLTALYHAGTGAYGDGSTFGQSLAVLAVRASGGTVPAEALAHLRGLQDSDGSWNFKAAANATDGDTNSTAIALVALSAVGDHSADSKAMAYLHTQQLADGGFPYQNSNAFGPPASDPDSDSLVLQALLSTGQDPTSVDWSKGSKTVVTHLLSTQAPDGGFVFPGNPKPDAFTTSQTLPALAVTPYGQPTQFTAGSVAPHVGCPPPTSGTTAPPTALASGGSDGGSETGIGLLAVALAGLMAIYLRRRPRKPAR